MTQQITMEKRWNSGQIHATSHSSIMLNCRNPSTVQDGRKCYNPDLIFTSGSIANMCKKSMMDPIPHTQYHPICVSAHPVIIPQTIPFRRRFNFMKADWNGYSTELDKLIEDVEHIPANYKCFIESVRVAFIRHIPRGCRTEYVPGLTDESKSIYEAYKCKYSSSHFDDDTIESGNTLIDKMTEEKRKRWEVVIYMTKHSQSPYTAPRLTIQTENTTSITSSTQTHNILQHFKAKKTLFLTTTTTQQTFPQTPTQSLQQT